MKKHLYIQLIEFTMNNQSFAIQQACDACKTIPRRFQAIAPSIFILNRQQRDGAYLTNEHEAQEWILKPEACFGYLQYAQYEHALSSSRRAQWTATVAVLITLLGLIASVVAA